MHITYKPSNCSVQSTWHSGRPATSSSTLRSLNINRSGAFQHVSIFGKQSLVMSRLEILDDFGAHVHGWSFYMAIYGMCTSLQQGCQSWNQSRKRTKVWRSSLKQSQKKAALLTCGLSDLVQSSSFCRSQFLKNLKTRQNHPSEFGISCGAAAAWSIVMIIFFTSLRKEKKPQKNE